MREDEAEAEFPISCETCLGDSASIRMIKSTLDKDCKICQRPCTGFRWQPGPKARYKTTIICRTCARLQNVCQVCLFDLQYGLPVQVRDEILRQHAAKNVPLGIADVAGMSTATRDVALQRIEADPNNGAALAGFDRDRSANEALRKAARMAPYYARNEARPCSFWLKGECTRGGRCAFKHEEPERNKTYTSSIKKMRERYFGVNDHFAKRILEKMKPGEEQEDA